MATGFSMGMAVAVLAAAGLAAPAVLAEDVNVGLIEIEDSIEERPGPLDWLFGDTTLTMRELLGKIAEAEGDADMDAVVIRLKEPELGLTQVEEIGTALDALRAKGKKVHIFAEGYSTPELILASHCDDVLLQSGGAVSLPGLYMEEMYLADTLNWAGVKADFVQVGDYKGASEAMARNAPSPQWEQNISGLLDSLYGNVRAAVLTGRKLTDGQLDEAMTKAWMADAATAKAVGLIDADLDLPDLEDHLEKAYDGDVTWTNLVKDEDGGGGELGSGNPFELLRKLSREPSHEPTRDTIAIVHIDGPIVDGDSTSGGFMGEESVGSTTIRRALQDIEDDDMIKGVVIRVNSPGGSAIASEVIWQGVRRVAAEKPVWVSVGNMAASGGYYIAVSGQKIYVNPSSIVGSIGVVGGKLAMAGLYDKLKVNVVGRARGPMGGILSSSEPWTEAQRQLVRQKMTETYDLFTTRVKAGREGIDLSKTAEGRLFTGNKAIGLKMADKVGGLETAIQDLASSLDLEEGAYDVLDYPAPQSLGDVLQGVFGSMAAAPAGEPDRARASALLGTVAKEMVGDRAWPQVRDSIGAMMQMRTEPVLLLSPRAIIVR